MSLRPPEDTTTTGKTLSGQCDKCRYRGLLYPIRVKYINGKVATLRLCYRDRQKMRNAVQKATSRSDDEMLDAMERQIAQDARRA